MIGNILSYVTNELNQYICRQQGLSPDDEKVFLSYVVDQDGSIATTEQNIVLVTMVDLSPDPLAYSQKVHPNKMGGVTETIDHSALHLNLKVLFSAYFKGERAKDALNYLTLIIQFFQNTPVFTKTQYPGLPEGLKKLEFVLEPLDLQTQSHMWGVLGAKYMPSVLYKMKMVAFYDQEPAVFTPVITAVNTDEQVR